MITVTLDATELLVLADALRADALPGLELPAPDAPEVGRRLMAEGQIRLEARGLVVRNAVGTLALDEALALIGGVLAYPELLCALSLRDAGGARRITYAYCDGLVVEAQAQGGQIVLTTCAGLSGLLGRIGGLLPDRPDPAADDRLLISPEGLAEVVAALAAGDTAAAGDHLDACDPAPGLGERLLADLEHPALRGGLTLLRYRGRKVVAARSPAFLIGASAAWWIAPAIDGVPALAVAGLGTRRMIGALARQLRRLGVAPRAA